MAEDGSAQNAATRPAPDFYFSVEIADVGTISCREVSGLEDAAFDVVEYRSGNMSGFAKMKMPGLKRCGDVTLKKVVFKDDQKLWDWINMVKMNVIRRVDMTVALLDGSGSPVQSWNLTNAWPKRYSEATSTAAGGQVSMEAIVIAHEGMMPA